MAFYPSNMAPISVKLWENAFQTFPDISSLDAPKISKLVSTFFENVGIDFF